MCSSSDMKYHRCCCCGERIVRDCRTVAAPCHWRSLSHISTCLCAKDREIHGGRNVWSERAKDSMVLLCLGGTVDRLAWENSVHWCGCMLREEDDGSALKTALEYEDEGRRKKGRLRKKAGGLIFAEKMLFTGHSRLR